MKQYYWHFMAYFIFSLMLSYVVIIAFQKNWTNICIISDRCTVDLSPDSQTWLHYANQDPLAAIQTLTHFLVSNPQHPIAKLRLGERHWQQGNEMEALTIWQGLDQADVYFAINSAHYARQTFTEDEWGKIQEWAEISLLINPEPSGQKRHLYESLCSIWEQRGEFEKALSWCQRKADAVRDGWSQLVLARVQFKAGYPELAEENLHWAADEGPQSLRGRSSFYLANHYLNIGNLSQACYYFGQAEHFKFPLNETDRQRYANCE